MIWWTKKTEWQVTPERVWISAGSGRCIFARARYSGIEVGDAYIVHPWEFEAVGNDSVPKRIREILVKQLTELYLKQYPDEPAHREYDEYDQADDCEDSLEISRRQALPSPQDSCSYAATHPVRRDLLGSRP